MLNVFHGDGWNRSLRFGWAFCRSRSYVNRVFVREGPCRWWLRGTSIVGLCREKARLIASRAANELISSCWWKRRSHICQRGGSVCGDDYIPLRLLWLPARLMLLTMAFDTNPSFSGRSILCDLQSVGTYVAVKGGCLSSSFKEGDQTCMKKKNVGWRKTWVWWLTVYC